MKRTLLTVFFCIAVVGLCVQTAAIAGTTKSYTLCAEMSATLEDVGQNMKKLTIDVDSTGDVADGVFPDSLVSELIRGGPWYFYVGYVFPESGGTGPTDGSNLFILNEHNQDLLGSEDCVYATGCTTAYNGLNALDNTSVTTLIPDIYITRAGEHVTQYPPVTGAWTIDIDNNVANADVNIVLIFIK